MAWTSFHGAPVGPLYSRVSRHPESCFFSWGEVPIFFFYHCFVTNNGTGKIWKNVSARLHTYCYQSIGAGTWAHAHTNTYTHPMCLCTYIQACDYPQPSLPTLDYIWPHHPSKGNSPNPWQLQEATASCWMICQLSGQVEVPWKGVNLQWV